MKNFLIAAFALVGTSMVGASPIDVGTSLVAASVFDVATSPASVDKRARLGYNFYIGSGQFNKCVGNGPYPTCTFQ